MEKLYVGVMIRNRWTHKPIELTPEVKEEWKLHSTSIGMSCNIHGSQAIFISPSYADVACWLAGIEACKFIAFHSTQALFGPFAEHSCNTSISLSCIKEQKQVEREENELSDWL